MTGTLLHARSPNSDELLSTTKVEGLFKIRGSGWFVHREGLPLKGFVALVVTVDKEASILPSADSSMLHTVPLTSLPAFNVPFIGKSFFLLVSKNFPLSSSFFLVADSSLSLFSIFMYSDTHYFS